MAVFISALHRGFVRSIEQTIDTAIASGVTASVTSPNEHCQTGLLYSRDNEWYFPAHGDLSPATP